MKKIRFLAGIPVLCLFTLSSCIGVRADISLRDNGSGRLSLEYRIDRTLDSLGRLDGNERWPTVPVGRADLERSLQRLPGMRLVSFSSGEEGKAILYRAVLEFADLQALRGFLHGISPTPAAAGNTAGSNTTAAGNNTPPAAGDALTLVLNTGMGRLDPDLAALVQSLCEGYQVEMSLTVPGEAELSFTDGRGNRIDPLPGAVLRGKKVSFSTGAAGVLSAEEGFGLEFRF
jgi:hypothetical protein